MKIFRSMRPVVGMVHLLPLPGAPRARALDEIRAAARADADALARGGVDGILIENYGDAPFTGGSVEPQVVATMAVLASEIRARAKLPIGVNVLRNDARSALAVALAAGADFIRVNVHVGAAETDQGRIDGRAYETLRYRKAIEADVAIFADVFVKHARPAGMADLASVARDTAYRGLAEVLLVTGTETGSAADPERVRQVKQAVPDRPVWVASGVEPGNVRGFGEADGFIVGSAFERGGRAGDRVEVQRVKALVRALKRR
ncbi:MAG TPA: BtpA/SgcQ family protein [Planctomycetota bacterium]|nr:BtpA/SgcQ family protein [Planctomycetota bacterium]